MNFRQRIFCNWFKNNLGGYELRNSIFKGSSSPKDLTIFKNNAKVIAVFEGFFDFLSYMAIVQNGEQLQANFLVLNSVSFFEKARPFMERHEVIDLYLDHDKTGQNCTCHALSLSTKYKDRSNLSAP